MFWLGRTLLSNHTAVYHYTDHVSLSVYRLMYVVDYHITLAWTFPRVLVVKSYGYGVCVDYRGPPYHTSIHGVLLVDLTNI